MPELPDVEIYTRYFTSTSLKRTIAKVSIGDEQILGDTTAQGLGRALTGEAFTAAHRHGKYLLAESTGKMALVLHFGMTGFLEFAAKPGSPPEHAQAIFDFDDGARLVFVCPRKLGEVGLSPGIEELRRRKDLGPDAAELARDFDAFARIVRSRRGMVKSLLMNQQVVSGIGNVYSDEILYQARLHPRTKTSELSESLLETLHEALGEVIATAIDAGARPEAMPDSWLLRRRADDRPCPCGGAIEKIKVAGRSGRYCPSCQKRP